MTGLDGLPSGVLGCLAPCDRQQHTVVRQLLHRSGHDKTLFCQVQASGQRATQRARISVEHLPASLCLGNSLPDEVIL